MGFSVVLLAFASAAVDTVAADTTAADTRPNIVFMLADDFGYGDLASFGNPDQEAGHLDAMAAAGMRMRQWYAGESLCTPSRAASMTGRLPLRTGMIPPPASSARVAFPTCPGGLPLSERTLGEMLRDVGYRTGIVGKWHLGINQDNSTDGHWLPTRRGFDHSGPVLPFSNHWACDEQRRHVQAPDPDLCLLYEQDRLVQQPIDHSNLTENMAADAVGFLREAAAAQQRGGADAKPFFLYFGFPQCHVNMFNSARWANSSRNGIFGANIREMDWAAGEVLGALDELGLAQGGKTIVFFTSDHGPHIELCLEGGRTGGLRGGKSYSSWEGGVRVPAAVYWPGVVAPGQTSDALTSSMDIFATALELANGTTSKPLDGLSLVPLLRAGAADHAGPRAPAPPGGVASGAAAARSSNTAAGSERALYHYCMDVLMAVRMGDFKLKFWSEELPSDDVFTKKCTAGVPHGEFFQTWACRGKGVSWLDPPQLYNVASDAAERWSLDYGAMPPPSPAPGPAPQKCTVDGDVLVHTGIPGVGYTPHPVVGADAAARLAACRADCCADELCGSVTLSTDPGGGACKPGDACCYFNPWHTEVPPASTARQMNSTLAYVTRTAGTAATAAAAANPYASVVAELLAAAKQHNASLVGDVHAPVLGSTKPGIQPCANPSAKGGCPPYNYPNANPHSSAAVAMAWGGA
jgi:arylsulfatase A-like enzyme